MGVQLMLDKVKKYERGTLDDGHIAAELLKTLKLTVTLAAGGAICGFIAGWITTVRAAWSLL
jgi:hypothetical protein